MYSFQLSINDGFFEFLVTPFIFEHCRYTAESGKLDDKPTELQTQYCKSCDSTQPIFLFNSILTGRPTDTCAYCQQSETSKTSNTMGVGRVRESSQKQREREQVEQDIAATKAKAEANKGSKEKRKVAREQLESWMRRRRR